MAQVGKPLDEWQALMVVDTFGLRDDGYWAAFEAAGLVPRQNGKGAYTEAVELGGLFLFRDQLIMHSAHLFKTAKQSFQRLVDIIDGSDWLTKRVHRVVRARGDEEIELTKEAGGGKFLCFSRSRGAGRGFTGDKTVFDECAYLTIEQYQAATPTLATVPNPQIIYTGTPPDEDVGPMPDDSMMPSVRRRAHAGGDRIALWEWRPPVGYDRADPHVWAVCNPALGKRIPMWFLAKQLENFAAAGKPEKFDTEHLGVWPPDGDEQWLVIPEREWDDARGTWTESPFPPAFCLEVSMDRGEAAWLIANRGPDRKRQVEIAELASGTAWTVPWMVERQRRWRPCAVVVDAAGPAGSLIADLEATGIEVLKPSLRQFAGACGAFYDGIAGRVDEGVDPATLRDIRQTGQGQLKASVAGLIPRKVGESSVFERAGSGYLAVGAALALWGHSVKAPKRYDVLDSVLIGGG